MSELSHSAKLGTMSIPKLLLKMSLPAIVSMLVQSLYNIVDSIFVAQYSDNALEALSIAFPLQMLTIALALGVGVGSKTAISRKLGEGNVAEASSTARNGLFMTIILAVFYIITALLIIEPFVNSFTNNSDVSQMSISYLIIVIGFSFSVFIEMMFSKTLQATGNMKVAMVSQLIGAIVNIILDPILIFGLLGFPSMGVSGAAIATVFAQFCSMVFCICMFTFKKQDVNFDFSHFKPNKKVLLLIIKVGLPVALMNALGSVTVIILNSILKNYDSAISILGIYFKLQSFVAMPMFGLVQGMLPILSFNFGAKNRSRFLATYKLSLGVALIMMIIGTIIFLTIPEFLLSMFHPSATLVLEGVFALRVLALSFIFASASTVNSSMFQSIGMGTTSLAMTLLRQLGLIIVFAIILSDTFGLRGIWFSFPIAEIITVAIFAPIAIITINRKLKIAL